MTSELIIKCKELLKANFNQNETLRLLKSSGAIMMSWGTSNLSRLGNQGLIFKTNGNHHKGYVLITLNWDDTYEVHLINNRARVLETITNVYWDELVNRIDEKVEKIKEYSF